MIVYSLLFHIRWIYEKEIDLFEVVWRVVVVLFLVSVFRKTYQQQEGISGIQKNIIFLLRVIAAVAGEISYFELLR